MTSIDVYLSQEGFAHSEASPRDSAWVGWTHRPARVFPSIHAAGRAGHRGGKWHMQYHDLHQRRVLVHDRGHQQCVLRPGQLRRRSALHVLPAADLAVSRLRDDQPVLSIVTWMHMVFAAHAVGGCVNDQPTLSGRACGCPWHWETCS